MLVSLSEVEVVSVKNSSFWSLFWNECFEASLLANNRVDAVWWKHGGEDEEEHMWAGGVTDSSQSWCHEYMVSASACQLAALIISDSVFEPRSAEWPSITAVSLTASYY